MTEIFNLIDPRTPPKESVGDVGVKGASILQNIFKGHYLPIIKFVFFAILQIILQVNHS